MLLPQLKTFRASLVLLLDNLALCMHLVRPMVYFLQCKVILTFFCLLSSCSTSIFSSGSDSCFISTCNMALSPSLQLILSLGPIHDLQFEIS